MLFRSKMGGGEEEGWQIEMEFISPFLISFSVLRLQRRSARGYGEITVITSQGTAVSLRLNASV